MRRLILFVCTFCMLACGDVYIKNDSLIEPMMTTVTSAGTLTLTKASDQYQQLTGTTTHEVVLPDATTLPKGRAFNISNASTGIVTLKFDDNSVAGTINPGSTFEARLVANNTTNGVWNLDKGGGIGVEADPTAWKLDGTALPTADQDMNNNALKKVKEIELDDGVNPPMMIKPDTLGGVGAQKFDFPSGADFTFGQGFGFSLYLRSSSGPAFLNLMTTPDDGTLDVGWSVVKDSALDGGGLEGMNFAWRPGVTAYSIDTIAISGGTNYPIRINANGSFGGGGTPNVTFNTDGTTTLHGDTDLSSGKVLKVAGTQVIGARKTGYTDPTGSSDKGSFDTTSVSTQDLAEFVKAMYEDLKAHGAIGN